MEEKKKEFLRLAVIQGEHYDHIEQILGLKRTVFAPWWDELKEERLKLTKVRALWKRKCPDLTFDEFASRYEEIGNNCFYCGITQKEMDELWKKDPKLTKRTRGRTFEIDRIAPNEAYKFGNLVLACYWCNNAKTDTFTGDEFKEVGKVFRQIWDKRLGK